MTASRTPPPPGRPTARTGQGRPPIDPRIRQRRAAVVRRRGRRRLRILVAFAVVVVLAVAVFGLLRSPLFDVRVVTVVGNHPDTTTASIIDASGLARRPPLIDVNLGATAARIETLPFVATADVTRQWPDGLHIAITERVPAAVMAGPGSSWSEVDRTGRTLQIDPTRPSTLVELIVNSAQGPVAPASIGRFLPRAATSGLDVCHTLPLAFSAQVTTVTADSNGTVSLALNSGLTVLLGTTADLRAKYEDVAAIIAHASLQGAKTIDVTVPQSPTVSAS